jgi:hypothetical protein
VREEGEIAKDDPGAKQARRDRQDEDLDEAALDEGKAERIEQGRRYPSRDMRLSLILRLVLD